MPDFKKMTVERLREVARKVLGPGYTRLKTKSDLIRALEQAEAPAPRAEPKAAGRPRAAAGKAVRAAKEAAKDAGKAAREGARQVVRAGRAAAGAAAEGARAAAAGAREGRKVARERKGGKVAGAAAAAAGAVAGIAAAARRGKGEPPEAGPDPEGYFVARVRGEEAVRDAPHPMCESGADTPQGLEEGAPPAYDERLGELPPGYGDDAFVALPRDPHTLFVYWDLADETRARAFEGLEGARAQLWIFARAGTGWDRLRTLDFALESRGYYVHDLEPGRVYRAEIHALGRRGEDRLVGRGSNEVALPPVGPSPIVDDRFVRIPWDMPLGRLLGPGHSGGPFSEEARALLARLSDWGRFQGPTWGSGSGSGRGGASSPSSGSGRSGEEE